MYLSSRLAKAYILLIVEHASKFIVVLYRCIQETFQAEVCCLGRGLCLDIG